MLLSNFLYYEVQIEVTGICLDFKLKALFTAELLQSLEKPAPLVVFIGGNWPSAWLIMFLQ